MSISKKLKSVLAAVLCMGMLAGCSSRGESSSSSEPAGESAPAVTQEVRTAEAGTDETSATKEASQAEATAADVPTEEPAAQPEVMNIAALKGPTAMGMIKMMSDEGQNENFSFTISGAADELTPAIIQGSVDIACVPANLASVLYNKTEGGVKVLAINTLGVLYICQNGEPTIATPADLKGRTIYASGKGATPEYALRYILSQNGIDPDNDVNIEWLSEHSECLSKLLTDEGSAAMLPQPFVTSAQTKNDGVNVVLDLNEEWSALNNGSALVTGVVIARTEFVEAYPRAVDEFLNEYSASVEYVNANNADAAQLIGDFDIVPAAVAEKALPKCNIVFISGAEMKEKLSGYLGVLFDSAAASVGGALPGDDFYYGA